MRKWANQSKAAIVLVMIMTLVLVLSACANNAASPTETNKGEETNAATGNSTDTAGKDPVTIKFWTWYPSADVYKPMLEQFEKENPHIKVDLTVTSQSLDYQQKVPLSLSTGEELDVVGIQPGFAPQVAPFLHDMETLLQEHVGADWETKYLESDMNWIRLLSEPTIMAPVGNAGAMVLYYNNKIFEELGLTAPTTYDELKNAVNTIKEKKPELVPLSVNAKEGWVLDEILWTLIGQKSDLYNKIRYNEGGKFDSPEYKEGLELMKRWFDDGVISQDAFDLYYDRAKQVFQGGQAAMYIQGTWEAGMISTKYRAGNKIELEDVGMTAIPVMEDGGKANVRAFLDYGLGVAKSSKHPEEVMELIKFLTLGIGACAAPCVL